MNKKPKLINVINKVTDITTNALNDELSVKCFPIIIRFLNFKYLRLSCLTLVELEYQESFIFLDMVDFGISETSKTSLL
jgi:hypothetical protein